MKVPATSGVPKPIVCSPAASSLEEVVPAEFHGLTTVDGGRRMEVGERAGFDHGAVMRMEEMLYSDDKSDPRRRFEGCSDAMEVEEGSEGFVME